MKNALTVIFILLAATCVQAQKEAPLPKDLPPYAVQPPSKVPDVKTAKLDNGLTVWMVSQPGLPKASFVIVVLGGMAADPPDRPGLSELLANALNQGTKTRNAKQIAEEMQSAGGDLGVSADRETVTINTSVLSSKAELAVGVLADVVRNASFPDNEVTLAKRNLTSSLQQNEAQPSFLARRAMARALFGSGPYSVVSPTLDSVGKMTADELRKEFARRFRPDQSIVIAVGDFDAAKMGNVIKEKLGDWKAPATPPTAVVAKPSAPAPHEVILVPRPNSVQTTLVLGGFGPTRRDPDYEPVVVANAIYGGTFTSRLVVNIREDKGYTYSPGAGLSILRQAGVLSTQADVRNAVTGASLNEIIYELNRMVTTSPTDEELSRAKRFLLGIEAISMQSRSAVAFQLANLWVNGLGPEGLETYNKRINEMTADEVNNAARKYFPASRMTIVTVGEEKVVREALEPFGLIVKSGK